MKNLSAKELGIDNPKAIYCNLSLAVLTEKALERKEAELMDTGALVVKTGKYTGRSAKDKFIVDTEDVHDNIAWGDVNMPISEDKFDKVYAKALNYLNDKEVYVFDGFAGADKSCSLKVRVINELPAQNLFIRDMLIRPSEEELANFGEPEFTIVATPGLKCVPEEDGTRSEAAILLNYSKNCAVICGTAYAGEIKKTVFSVMNYLLPLKGILPMHCSANMDPNSDDTAVFFGLSGTGKTTLSADPNRLLIGDDEHGWTDKGVFNFEGGCYAKCIHLSQEAEPEIYNAVKFGSVVENVVVDPETRVPDYDDNSLTENTRVAYPIEYIPNSASPSVGGIPKVVIFLTADAFGVLPPISLLSKNAAMYQFVSGFTAKVAGTEIGVTEPQPTFSTLFGEPFMPMRAEVYAKMLGERIDKYGTKVYLINTGWTGGAYGTGSRMKLAYTRAMVTAALNDEFANVEFKHDERFNVEIPQSCPEVPSEILNPRDTWADKEAYDVQANKLAKMFADNFAKKYPDMSAEIKEAGPKEI